MKTIHLRCATARHATLFLILFLTASSLWAQMPGAPGNTAAPAKEVAGYSYNFPGVDVNQVLDVYANLVGRTMLRAGLPNASITLKTQTPLTKTEAIEALQAVLALNGIAVVNIGDKFVKVLSPDQANSAGGEFNDVPASELPDLGSYVTHIVQLKYVKPSVMQGIIQPFGRLPNSITPIDDNGILVIRDYAENVKRMLEMIDKIDISVPAVYISEVIPIRYALADDIASALNSLGGSGGATVSVGSSAASPTISGLANRGGGTGLGGMGSTTQSGINNMSGNTLGQPRTANGATNPNGTPSSSTPFQQRLLNIINRAGAPGEGGGGGGGQQQIQIFGQAKIIADERANALLVFATRQDMDQIKHVISQLDVLLSQVLIEAVIMDYSLGPNETTYGVSVAQNPKNITVGNTPLAGAGGVNNGQTFLSFLNGGAVQGLTNATSVFGNSLPGGFSYFGNIGPTWDVALAAAATDSHASIIQRPRIQTSQAKPASFFVGQTVPYVTGSTYGSAYGNSSSYSQLSVGVELDVTPFINPDGLVVMDVQQEIDDINGSTLITGVGNIPNTDKRTLSSEIAVRNGDTVMLGGFIRNQKSTSKTGVPLLQDIPLLGFLFSQHDDKKQREELIVLMRPTVLKTPEIAALQTIKEEQRLPGISAAAADEAETEHKLINAERKKESKNPETMRAGFYNATIPTNAPDEQSPQPQDQGDSTFTPVMPYAPVVQPNGNNNADPAVTDEKARAALEEKKKELDAQQGGQSAPPPPPPQ
jgi:general secretion pathway protein D